MHEREKSDLAVVAVKLANKAERSAAELVERRAGTKGNAGQHSTYRAQYRASVSQVQERIRHVRRQTPEVGAVCGKAARTDLCGGRSAMGVPSAIVARAPRNDGCYESAGIINTGRPCRFRAMAHLTSPGMQVRHTSGRT